MIELHNCILCKVVRSLAFRRITSLDTTYKLLKLQHYRFNLLSTNGIMMIIAKRLVHIEERTGRNKEEGLYMQMHTVQLYKRTKNCTLISNMQRRYAFRKTIAKTCNLIINLRITATSKKHQPKKK